MEENFVTYYQNPKTDYLFGFFGGSPIPTKQDKFKQLSIIQVDDDGTRKLLNNIYTKKPNEFAIQEFNAYIQGLAKEVFKNGEIICRPAEIEVVLAISVTEKRYKTVDLDNLAKTVLDSLIGIAYEDDSQIASLICNKHIHPLKINGLMIGVTKLTAENGGFDKDINLFSITPWRQTEG